MKKKLMVRQGDVLLVETEAAIPKTATEVKRDGGQVVLAYGEVTGHSHAIADEAAVLFALADGSRMLRATKRVVLRHEEHAKIELPAANYRVVIQREYVPNELPRSVVD